MSSFKEDNYIAVFAFVFKQIYKPYTDPGRYSVL